MHGDRTHRIPKQNLRTTGVFCVWVHVSNCVCMCVCVWLVQDKQWWIWPILKTTINTARRLEHRHADIVLQDKKLKEGKGRKERKTQRDSGVIACDSLPGALVCITFKSYPLSYYGAGREENSGKKMNKKKSEHLSPSEGRFRTQNTEGKERVRKQMTIKRRKGKRGFEKEEGEMLKEEWELFRLWPTPSGGLPRRVYCVTQCMNKYHTEKCYVPCLFSIV